jgi:hypothetical protein
MGGHLAKREKSGFDLDRDTHRNEPPDLLDLRTGHCDASICPVHVILRDKPIYYKGPGRDE